MTTPMEEERYGIAFFDLETTIPTRPGQGHAILEFGSILVCPRRLVELESYSTLVRPSDLSLITELSDRRNGITRDAVSSAPPFIDIADRVHDHLHGRIWAGHNILGFDCPRIREAFVQIGRPAPEPKGCIDTLAVLRQKFGTRTGDMKMATFASYFCFGEQIHRSLEDVRMNLEVVKHCAAVLFLESSLPDMTMTPSSNPVERSLGDRILDLVQSSTSEAEPFNTNTLGESSEITPSTPTSFLIPDQVSIQSITAALVPTNRGYQRVQILHRNTILKLECSNLKVRFGVSRKYHDQAGRPRLSIVVDAPLTLCLVLDASDSHAQNFFMQSGSTSDWRPVVTRKYGYPTIRLHIPTIVTGEVAKYGTEICHKETGVEQRLQFSRSDPSELDALFTPGVLLDAHMSLDPYDFKQNAGIRLVAEKLVILSENDVFI